MCNVAVEKVELDIRLPKVESWICCRPAYIFEQHLPEISLFGKWVDGGWGLNEPVCEIFNSVG